MSNEKIQKIGKPECKLIRRLAQTALNDALKEFGLKAELGNMTFRGSNVTSKLTVSVESYDADKEEFRANCYKYGLTATDFGAEFTSQGETYKLVGIKPRSRKYPFVGERVDGKKYKFTKHIVSQIVKAA